MREDIRSFISEVSKPGRYTGGEAGALYKDKSLMDLRVAFCFPDVYEIGMSNLGMKILCGALNEMDNVWCERVFAPWPDMEEKMRERGIPLFTHESGDGVGEFDIVAFTLQYELCYTNVVNMLDLAGIPVMSADRDDSCPIVIAGGHCAMNPEPMADFVDIFSVGEGEEALPELARLYIDMKKSGAYTRKKFLLAAAGLEGFYVPSLYEVSYNADGTIDGIEPKCDGVPKRVRRRIVADLDSAYFPDKTIIPNIETVHDRVTLEVFRGCIRGCRFCQAGFICRPVREKSPETLCRQARAAIDATGYDEISMCCLSISDYSQISSFTDGLLHWTDDARVNISLPSLRADSFTRELMDKISSVRTSTLTFAPEAGSPRLRDIINKNITEEDILKAASLAFSSGKTQVKLYFMNGLPHETDEDIAGISALASEVIEEYYRTPGVNKKQRPQVTLSVACFIPKPHTPFEREPQALPDVLLEKQKYLSSCITDRKIRYNYHDAKVSRIEAVFARGDRRLGAAILKAVKEGETFDAWTEYFSYEKWLEIFDSLGLDPAFYANRTIPDEEILPWDVIDCGVTKEFLLRERHKAAEAIPTPACHEKCSACGANAMAPAEECRWCPGGEKKNANAPAPIIIPAPEKPGASSPKPDPALKPVRTVRVRFSKKDSLSYIGHLDLMNTMSRLVIRSGLPVWYTEGFNPHPKLVFATPLSVGHAGEREVVDVKIVEDVSDETIVETLRPLTPAGMEIIEAFTAEGKLDRIKWAENEIFVHTSSDISGVDIEKLFDGPVIIMKKSKSGEKETDISELIREIRAERTDGGVKITAVTAADSSKFLNPSYIAKVVKEKLGVPEDGGYVEYTRKKLLLEDGITEIR
ncbi:MAG: TIGR03960 family B12-binding radical SAM protein [Ruminococcaceae bacterium]|nr:TIGR03960 family B12-binding radical SAM protein [Oscillospiraceae bacterium]